MDEHSAARLAVARLQEFTRAVGSHLEGLLTDLIHSRGFDQPDVLLNPLAQPLVQVPLWATEALADPGALSERTLEDLVEAAVVGYLHVRIQDDIVDGEATGDATEAMLLSDALLIRHQTLIARTVGTSGPFWETFQSLALGYGDAMLFERSLHRGAEYSATAFARVLERSMPLAIPALAVLDVGDAWDAAEGLCTFVRHAVTAGQLVDDLRDVLGDVTAGRRTWVSVRLGGDRGPEAVVGSLVFGAFEDIIDAINRAIDEAETAAAVIGMLSAAAWMRARREAVSTLAETFTTALGSDPRHNLPDSG